jgi:hypothetical protein
LRAADEFVLTKSLAPKSFRFPADLSVGQKIRQWMLVNLRRRFLSIQVSDRALMGVLNMPIDLVLVRHATAEGNIAFGVSRRGDHQFFTPSFMELHESRWRFTATGRKEAMITGKWIRENISSHFD